MDVAALDTFVVVTLFVLLVASALAIVVMKRLFGVVILSGVFSLLSALLFVAMDAVDVAFTEAAVGAGISTVLMLGTIALTAREAKPTSRFSLVPFAVVVLVGGVLIYGTLDMPNFGDPNAPVQTHVAGTYLQRTAADIDIPNVVSAVLASYRGHDTLGEVIVVLTAGFGVILLISQLGRRGQAPPRGLEETDDVTADRGTDPVVRDPASDPDEGR